MIEVTYYREYNRLTVKGHARSDEYGKDLICAACSILALTLSTNVTNMAEGGYVSDPLAVLDEGNAEISCKARPRFRQSVRQVFVSVCVGFEILANKWPEYIRYTVQGK